MRGRQGWSQVGYVSSCWWSWPVEPFGEPVGEGSVDLHGGAGQVDAADEDLSAGGHVGHDPQVDIEPRVDMTGGDVARFEDQPPGGLSAVGKLKIDDRPARW